MSKKPEGATHWFPETETKNSGWVKVINNEYWFWGEEHTEWMPDDFDGPIDLPSCIPLATVTPTLETMLIERRDLEARAQAAQSEADALFEHAGQLHGEIVVRLAELGWGAPRGPMVPGEPVVTLDEPVRIQKGDIVELIDRGSSTILRVGHPYRVLRAMGDILELHADANWVSCSHVRFISRPSTQP